MTDPTSNRDDSLRQYLIEEFLEDYEKGQMSRRDALKRLVGLTASVALSNALLAACAPAAPAATGVPTAAGLATAVATAPATTAAATAASATVDPTLMTTATATVAAPNASVNVSPDNPALHAEDATFPSQGATVTAYLARPSAEGAYPAILVCHENRGLTDHIKDVTRRLALAGYVGLAVDLLSRQGGTGAQSESAVPGLLGNMSPDQMVGDFAAALEWLKGQSFVKPGQFGMTGFCFGGGITWRCATKLPDLLAAVPFYGPNPPLGDVPNIKAAVLAIYAGLDTRIDAGIPAIEKAMKDNGKTFEYVVYPNVNHAFHNDTGGSYNAEAARAAWAKTLEWFGKYVNKG